MSMDEKAFYTISEFAKKLGIHAQTVRKMIKSGRVCGFRIGGENSRFRIPASEVQRLALFELKNVIKNIKEEDL